MRVESAQTHRSQALVRRMKTVFEQYIQNYKSVPPTHHYECD